MLPLPLSRIRLEDPFWNPRLDLLRKVTLPQQFEQIANRTGRLENFRKAARRERGGHSGIYYDDSDVYKWLEACAYALAGGNDTNLHALAHEVIEAVLSAQMDDGYLNTFFQLEHPELRFRNLAMMHELYCMGHFIEAAVAFDESLGEDRLLDAALKMLDLLQSEFGERGRPGYCGHEEIEVALVRLGLHTGRQVAIELAGRMIDLRGTKPSIFDAELNDSEGIALSPWAKRMLTREGKYSGEYVQDHAPIREHRIVVGHAVRAMYLYTAGEFFGGDDHALAAALDAVWENLTQRRMYITGGIGSTAANEGFTSDYDLPNHNSYAETCAAVGLALWGRARLGTRLDSSFADIMERAIFNGAIAGISDSGDRYFYANPLESRFDHARSEWFDCACCPPNIARLIGSIGRFAITEGEGLIALHIPIGGTYETSACTLTIESGYPFDGRFKLSVGKPIGHFDLAIRMPGWCDDATLTMEGQNVPAEYEDGYMVVKRNWRDGDRIEVEWSVEPKWIQAHPYAFDANGKFALQVGPLVYCLESLDPNAPAQLFSPDIEAEVNLEHDSRGLRRAMVPGFRFSANDPGSLYFEAGDEEAVECTETFIPYFTWSNRGPSSMAVWLRRI